jgi:hypothetical protein
MVGCGGRPLGNALDYVQYDPHNARKAFAIST